MATAPAPLSIEEYLDTSYEPECEYVDGELIPKAMGTNDHARLQARITRLLYRYEEAGLCQVVTEQSLRVRKTAILIPDVCLLRPDNDEHGVVTKPALLCIEVLSPSDRFAYTLKKCEEYLRWGVPACWIFDPTENRAWVYNARGLSPVAEGGTLRMNEVELSLAELWSQRT
jgi:Uma2 family endonuclease